MKYYIVLRVVKEYYEVTAKTAVATLKEPLEDPFAVFVKSEKVVKDIIEPDQSEQSNE